MGKLYNATAGHVASGEFFTERGKQLVLRKSFESDSKKWFRGKEAKEILEGEKYLDDVMRSFKELYNLVKSGDYAQRMPELASAVSTVYDMGFADAAVNVLYENGLMDKERYKVFKKAVREKTKQGVEATGKTLTDYLMPEKVAAVVLGVLGLGILTTSNSITGNVIGVSGSTNFIAMILGAVVLGTGVWMFFRKKK